MVVNRDGYSTSWSTETEIKWDMFRELVRSGTDVDDAAKKAGIHVEV